MKSALLLSWLLCSASTVSSFAPSQPAFVVGRSSTIAKTTPIKLYGMKERLNSVFGNSSEKGDVSVLEKTKLSSVVTKEQNNAVPSTTSQQPPKQYMEELSLPEEPEEELSETKKLMKQVKEAGVAGIISYALWEVGFWTISVPVVIFGYREVTGHWPDLSEKDDVAKMGAEAFAFVNFARFAVPLRIGLALSTTPWIQQNIVDRFFFDKNKDEPQQQDS